VLVDGAHAPGQVELDLSALGVDWYTGNCHKWLSAPKGCAFLHARRDRQDDLHPSVISHGYGDGFTAEFDWTGTWDPSAYLSVTAALDFHARLGGTALMARNASLAFAAGNLVAARLGTETVTGNAPTAAMAMVRLPRVAPADAPMLRDKLFAAGTDAPLHVHDDAVWLRLSAYAYNELADYARLAEITATALHR
jgi:isopenicillin-N epimerase